MQMLCALFSFIKMIKQQWASWARSPAAQQAGSRPGTVICINTNIHDTPPQSPAVPRSCPASPALELELATPLSLVWVCGGSAGGRARLIVRWAAALFSFHQRNSGARLVGDV